MPLSCSHDVMIPASLASAERPAPAGASTVSVAMVQDNFTVGDIAGNAARMVQHVRQLASQGVQLAVFPELALTGYPPEDLLLRPGFIDDAMAALETLAPASREMDIVLGAPWQDEQGLHNSALWLRDGAVHAIYHKQCLPNYSVFDEMRYFIAGEQPVTVSLNGVRFALAICEDIWCTQKIRQGEADCLLVLNASPWHIGKYEERVEVIQQRAREYDCPVLYLNMVGGQDELVFDGESLVCNRAGEIQHRAAAFESCVERVDVGRHEIDVITRSPAQPLSQTEAVYRALVLGVKDFVHKNGFAGVVIGLSGGVDSALTLAIAVDALGADNVQAVMMPSMYTADISQSDAKAEAEALGVRYDVIAIEKPYHAFMDALHEVFAGREADTTEENIQARCRGVLLMAISNKTGRMVLTTGNKSEMAVGYATLYGDMSGSFAPLKDVSKMLVYELCRYRNRIAPVIPERVLTRPPSAELRPDQTDQDSLPDYAVLDKILELSVEQDKSVDEIVATGIDRDTVEHVVALVRRNEYKRRQAAPGVRITKRAFGRDRRYPITSAYREF